NRESGPASSFRRGRGNRKGSPVPRERRLLLHDRIGTGRRWRPNADLILSIAARIPPRPNTGVRGGGGMLQEARAPAKDTLIRSSELSKMLGLIRDDGPRLVYVHGIAGIGKSTLLSSFATAARTGAVTVVGLDCRSIEPTERGFLHCLSRAIGSKARSPGSVAVRLGNLGERVVLTLDTYEVFRFLDVWLREVFLPSLPPNVRVVLCGREPPVADWLMSGQWDRTSFGSLHLQGITDDEAFDLLENMGVDTPAARRINRLAHGNPLALKLAAATVAADPSRDLEIQALPEVIDALARLYLADVTDPVTRRVLQACSVVRRVTHS